MDFIYNYINHFNFNNNNPIFSRFWICLDFCFKNYYRSFSWCYFSCINRLLEVYVPYLKPSSVISFKKSYFFLWSVWGPPLERSQLIAIYVAGNSVGTCLIFPLGGILADSEWGWRSIFYVTGGCGVLWSIFWVFLAFDSPSKHPRYT